MIIERLILKNFRQFNEIQSIDFSTRSDKNITVIHGANGSGKTSLLNAFKWCFYGETDFDTYNDNILNDASIYNSKFGDEIEIEVIVSFYHNSQKYTAKRVQQYRVITEVDAESINESVFILEVIDDSGETKRLASPQVHLKSILPKDLQPYFFFNGERIEHISGVNQTNQIQEAIKRLMGLEIVDRSKKHLKSLKSIYNKQLQNLAGDEEKLLLLAVDNVENKIDRAEILISELDSKKTNFLNKITDIDNKLKKFEKSRKAQERREDLESKVKRNDDEIKDIIARQNKYLSTSAFIKISSGLFESCTALIDKNRQKGILPYRINHQFISDRIKMGECICGHEIEPGSKYHQTLLKVQHDASIDEHQSNYTDVNAFLKSCSGLVETFDDEYTVAATRYKSLIKKNTELSIEIDEAGAEISNLDDKLINELEIERSNAGEGLNTLSGDISFTKLKITDLKKELVEKQKFLSRIQEQKSEKTQANMALDLSNRMITCLNELSSALVGQVRDDLSGRVEATFKSIIRKPLRAIIDEKYCLQVLKQGPDGNELLVSEQSTGERQVTSLCFIASIISLAKDKHNSLNKDSFLQGGLYPLVMDSPFGALDDDYREKVASKVSELAEQVVIFVSNSQWSGNVKAACEEKVGKSYKLVYHSPKIKSEHQNEYTRCSDTKFEYSTLQEIKNEQ